MSIYAVDFDGTLCNNIYPKIGSAKQEVIDKLIKLKEEDNKLILWTCRTGEELENAVAWCTEKGLEFDSVNENLEEVKEEYDEDSRKVVATYYLDDKALTIDDFLEEQEVNNMSKLARIFNFNETDKKSKKVLNRGTMEIKNATDDTAELYMYGDIVSDSWQSYWYDEDKCPQDIVDFLSDIENTKELNIYINSGGGSVHAGLAIYNILKRHKGNKTVYIDGIAASIASVIAMAGDKVIIKNNAQFMIHKPLTGCWGNADDFQKAIDILNVCQKSIMAVYMENIKEGVTEKTIEELLNKESWFVGSEAAKYFNMEVEGSSEIVAHASDYFDSYKNVPETLELKNRNQINEDEIANKVLKAIEDKKKLEQKELENNLENEKQAILEDLDLI